MVNILNIMHAEYFEEGCCSADNLLDLVSGSGYAGIHGNLIKKMK